MSSLWHTGATTGSCTRRLSNQNTTLQDTPCVSLANSTAARHICIQVITRCAHYSWSVGVLRCSVLSPQDTEQRGL
jgi:hypothetical protein